MFDFYMICIQHSIESAKHHCSTHDQLVEKIVGMMEEEGRTFIEVSEVVPNGKNADTGGFFANVNSYISIVDNKDSLRFAEVNTGAGATFNRYIRTPADMDIGDDYFINFAFNLADQIIKDSVYIFLKNPRDKYIEQALLDRGIYLDVLTFNQITKLVQKAFLEKYRRMWLM